MIYDETREYHDRDAVKELLDAAREWAPTKGTRNGSGTRQRLCNAVAALAAVDVEDLYDAIYERGQESGREQERMVWHS